MKDNVVGHPGYHVTKNGEIYSYSRGAWKLRKTSNTSSTGRIRVKIGTKWLQVSRLVALAWVHNPKPEFKISSIFGISKRHISKIISQYKEGIRWDN